MGVLRRTGWHMDLEDLFGDVAGELMDALRTEKQKKEREANSCG